MKYISLTIAFNVLTFGSLYSQTPGWSECWKVDEGKTRYYFNILFSKITDSDPDQAIIKLSFLKSSMLYVGDIQILREYCRIKYNLPDSLVKEFANDFVRSEKKVSLEDTSIIKIVDKNFNQYSFFSERLLDEYKALGVRKFLIKYCKGDILVNRSLSILAYLFENRIFWNNLTGRISTSSLYELEQACKIKWDYQKSYWVDLKTNKVVTVQ